MVSRDVRGYHTGASRENQKVQMPAMSASKFQNSQENSKSCKNAQNKHQEAINAEVEREGRRNEKITNKQGRNTREEEKTKPPKKTKSQKKPKKNLTKNKKKTKTTFTFLHKLRGRKFFDLFIEKYAKVKKRETFCMFMYPQRIFFFFFFFKNPFLFSLWHISFGWDFAKILN